MAGRTSRAARLIAAAQSILRTGSAESEWRRLPELDARLLAAVVLAEDRHFWRHRGVDWSAARAATVRNVRERRTRFGASTIPMQVARMMRGWSRRTYARKLAEAVLGCWLIARHSREAVLEVYVNLAPFAAGTRGVASGCRRLLDCDPGQLRLFEATLPSAAPSGPPIAPGSTPRLAPWLRYQPQPP